MPGVQAMSKTGRDALKDVLNDIKGLGQWAKDANDIMDVDGSDDGK